MKHTKELLASELNKVCEVFDMEKEDFNNNHLRDIFIKSYVSKFNFLYSEIEQIKDDMNDILGGDCFGK